MNETRTAGKWQVSEARGGYGEFLIVGGEGQTFGCVAAVTLEGDANLIAASPDYHAIAEDSLPILEAVLEDRENATGEEDEILRDLIDRIRAAIARATAQPKES